MIELISKRVVERYVIYVNRYAVILLNKAQCLFDNREGFQSQKVHFNNACIFDNRAFVLCNKQVRIFGNTNGNNIFERTRRNDDSRCVYACSTNRPFEDDRFFQDAAFFCVAFVNFAELFTVFNIFAYKAVFFAEATLAVNRGCDTSFKVSTRLVGY